MSWVRIDDQFFAHPKVVGLSKDAKLLYLASITYSSQQLTDGRVPAGAVRVIAAFAGVDDLGAIPELLDADLWERIPDGYAIHDYLDYQPAAETVRHERASARERMAVLRAARREGPAPNGTDHPSNNGSAHVRPNSARSSESVRSLTYTSPYTSSGTSGSTSGAVPPDGGVAAAGRTTAGGSVRVETGVPSSEADAVLEHWRRAFGKRAAPRLNPTQAQQLAEAVAALGVARLCNGVDWAAGKGLGEFSKSLAAAYTQQQHDDEQAAPPPNAASGVTHVPREPGVYATGVRCACGHVYSKTRPTCFKCGVPQAELVAVAV